MMDRDQELGRVVVLGGSVAGLAAAAALAPKAREVLVLERHALPDQPTERSSVSPQGTAPHLLLAGGAAALERLLPGYTADLVAHGAVGSDTEPFPCHWWAAGGVRRTSPSLGVVAPFCTRVLVESRLRARVQRLANVALAGGIVVRGLRVVDGRVVAVEAEEHGAPRLVEADLVIDASGRGSRTGRWLAEACGAPEPDVSRVEVDVTYTAVFLRRHPSDVGGGRFAVVQNGPSLTRIGVALAAEDDRWQVVLGGYFGDSAPTDRAGLLDFARSLPDPVVAELLENEWLTEPALHRFPSSQRRRWERVRRPVAGFCAIGDAFASFNPLYGQGMSAAVLQAEALGAAVDRVGNTRRLPREAHRAIARVVENPWRIATGADFAYAQTRGAKPPGTDLVNRYMERVLLATSRDERVNLAFLRVQQLLAPPTTLFHPALMARVLRATRVSDVPAAAPRGTSSAGSGARR